MRTLEDYLPARASEAEVRAALEKEKKRLAICKLCASTISDWDAIRARAIKAAAIEKLMQLTGPTKGVEYTATKI